MEQYQNFLSAILILSHPCGLFLESPNNFSGLQSHSSTVHVSKNREEYAPETPCMKGTSGHINKTAL